MGKEEIEILQAEWREQVIAKIDKISNLQDKLADKIDNSIKKDEFEKAIYKLEIIIEKQQDRIEELEKNKYFVLGFACLLQIVIGWIIYLVKK